MSNSVTVRTIWYWAAFLSWSLLMTVIHVIGRIEIALSIYLIASIVGLLLVQKIEKSRYLRSLRSVDSQRWQELTQSDSYKWLGSLSPLLLKQIFSRTEPVLPQLEEPRRAYRQSEIFFYSSVVVVMILMNLMLLFENAAS